jgi:Zn-dependent peptidase ImmA (M78 family)/transcriptional regulator with XRE-family HTH domain
MVALSERELARIASLVNPNRVRLAREARGWTQTELVHQLDGQLTAGAISQIEHGRVRPSGPTVRLLADALEFPPTFFLRRDDDTDVVGFFRSLRSTPARVRKQALAQAQLLHDLATAVERHVRLPEVQVPRFGGERRQNIEKVATKVRREWNIPDGPIPNVVRVLERHGVITARVAVDRHDIDAFSVWFTDRPVVILGNDKNVAARSRFDAAHELGHLALHRPDQAGTREAEQEAHEFAAAFLAPADMIRDQLPKRVDWRELVDLKAEWGVSIAALLRRARDLEVISDHAYVNAVKAMSARGWRRDEPGDELLGKPERPVLLRRAVALLNDQDCSLDDLAMEAGLPTEMISRLLGRQDSRPSVDL